MGGSESPRITYLCLQPMEQGQASYAHVSGICDGLRSIGWQVRLVALSGSGDKGLTYRVGAVTLIQLRFVLALVADRPCAVYVRWHPASILGVAVARCLRLPVALEVNGPVDDITAAWPSLHRAHRLMERSLRWQVRRSTIVFTVTEGLRAWLEPLTSAPVKVVPNAADPTHFFPAAEDEEVATDYVLFFGALAPWQGLPELLAAATDPRWPTGVELHIAGDGNLRPLVEETVRRSPDVVRYLGQVPHREMPAVVRQSRVVAILKDYHRPDLGLSPVKLYEAMAAGVAVVATDLPGLGDVVRHADAGTVLSHPPTHDEILRAISALIADDGLQRRIRERSHVSGNEHTWESRARATASSIQDCIPGIHS